MNVLVVCVNAKNGGAETILRNFCEECEKDVFNTYYICTSLIKIENRNNIINLQYPKTKKSYLNRIIFDLFETKKLIAKYSIDEIISLQNIGIFNKNIYQILYIQQSLPFVDNRYNIFHNFKYWFYQNIFFLIMKKSLKYVNQIVVQTEWMKKAICSKCEYRQEKIIIKRPIIENKYNYYFDINKWNNMFIYPTSNEEYKNYNIIFYAIKDLLNKKGDFNNVKIVLTLKKEELRKDCLDIYNMYPNNFALIGYVKEEELYKYYASSILIFPSVTESLGLPILEAMSVGTTVVASDTVFARELLDAYDCKELFKKNDYKQLSNIIERMIRKNEKKQEN